jgi:hypothetical protein
MALNLLRSGYATLEYEIAQERASALGRLGRQLERASDARLRSAERGACPHGLLAMPNIPPTKTIGVDLLFGRFCFDLSGVRRIRMPNYVSESSV